MYTSYYGNPNIKGLPNLVSISQGVPKGIPCRVYKALAPTWEMIKRYHKDRDEQAYIKEYAKILAKLDPHKVYEDLGGDAILLCYEKPGEFCHRHLVADWLSKELGLNIVELDKEVVSTKSLECSTRGDKRFSALCAKVNIQGKVQTIEEFYQLSKRFNDIAPRTWRDAKGKKPTHINILGKDFPVNALTDWYEYLWIEYFKQNPTLLDVIKEYDVFTDMFAGRNSINSQANVISYIRHHGLDSLLAKGIYKQEISMHLYPTKEVISITGKTVCFTGHRPNKLGGYNENNPIAKRVKDTLRTVIQNAIDKGYTHFISGGALGVDQWAAEIVLDLKSRGATLTIAVPHRGYGSNWTPQSKRRYEDIISRADEVIYLSQEEYSPVLMQKRNEWMVDHSDVVIAVWDGTSGGTCNCVRYAKSKKKPIKHINPNNTAPATKSDTKPEIRTAPATKRDTEPEIRNPFA